MVQFVEVFDGIHNVLALCHSRHLDQKLGDFKGSSLVKILVKLMMMKLIVMLKVVVSPSSLTQNLRPQDKWRRPLFHRLPPPSFHLKFTF